MKGPPTGYWAKLEVNEQREVVAWHPLVDHCADVAAVAEALLQRTLLRRRLACLGGLDDLSSQQVARLCVLAALHDLGKANLGFQNKSQPWRRDRFTAGHLSEVMAILDPAAQDLATALHQAIDVETLVGWAQGFPEDGGAGLFGLLGATISHHGRPVPVREIHLEDLWLPVEGRDPFAEIGRLVNLTQTWFPGAWQPGGDLLPTNAEFQHGWCGVLTLADWLGSDSADDRFRFRAESDPDDRMPFARERAREILQRVGLDPGGARQSLGPNPPGFDSVVPEGSPRAEQAAILALPIDRAGAVTVLEAETGSGKTEAALARFLRLHHAGEVDGMVFALPTRTAATQIHRRIEGIVRRAFTDPESRPPVVLAVPGYLRVDDVEGVALPQWKVLWDDNSDSKDRAPDFRHRGWAAEDPKRYLAGSIVVGTIDQVLLSALQTRHSHLRASALLRQFLVVDEVHASDAYMTRVLDEVLQFHRAAGGHALLLSATLGGEARQQLLATQTERRSAEKISWDQAVATAYPAVTHRPHGTATELRAVAIDPTQRPPKSVHIDPQPWIDDPAEVAAAAVDAARRGAKVLVIRNRVIDCRETQRALEALNPPDALLWRCEGVVATHHGRYAAADRKALDRAIERDFGKERTDGGRIAVTTQTVEQSLDLDADLLLTDLCPMDVLLQRIGRLHRHSRDTRPAGFEHARAVVLMPSTEALGARAAGARENECRGLGTVYEDLRVLKATRQQLEDGPTIEIPTDNRRLVEGAIHSKQLERLVDELGGPWPDHAGAVDSQESSKRRVAEINTVDRMQPFTKDIAFPDQSDRKIPTRLGLADRQVSFEPPVESPFGQIVDTLKVSHRLTSKVASSAELAEEIKMTKDGFTFRFGNVGFRYNRYGLARISREV
ncbi:MAG: CRISPR-associated helicase Cas3' [Acidobacteriota bacterium]